jgi:multidrug efflux system membrane fusion protein
MSKVERRDVSIDLSVVGRAEAFSTVSVRSRVDGQVQAVRFTAGQYVKKDQVLIELDPRPLEAQWRQTQGNLARDQAQLAKARADLERQSDLAKRGFVSPSAVDGYKAAVDTLAATLKYSEAAVDFAKVQLSFATIRAPMDGIAGAVLIFPGGNVKANDTPMVVINKVQPIYVNFSIPEAQLDGVRSLMRRGAVPVQARTRDGSLAQLQGRLSFIDNAIDTATGTIVLKAEFSNSDGRLTPGQFVDVKLNTRLMKDVVALPIEAMQMGPNGNFVFVVKDDNSVEMRPVKKSITAGQLLVVEEGFEPGERVVIDGQLRLFPGARIDTGAGRGEGKGDGKGKGKGEGKSEGKAEGKGDGEAKGENAGKGAR